MIYDLNVAGSVASVATDVCVVGAGPVGLALAKALADKGLRVTVLEGGSERAEVFECQSKLRFDRAEYRGATLGRAFGLGGTSAVWGGQLLPIAPEDLGERESAGIPAWPLDYAAFEGYFAQIENWLGVDCTSGSLEGSDTHRHPAKKLRVEPFTFRLSKWIGFGRRNFGKLMERRCRRRDDIDVWLNAPATEWDIVTATDQRIKAVIAQSASGNRLRVQAKQVVIAAGALESARLLLEIQNRWACLPDTAAALVGRFLHDHLSLRIAEVRIRDRLRFGEMFAPMFSKGTMRTLKLELAGQAAWSRDLPSLYLHFVAEALENSGFAVIRDLLRAAQRGQFQAVLKAFFALPTALPGVAEMLYWRFVRQRLVFPQGAQVFLHVDFEQPPRRDNRLYVSDLDSQEASKCLHIDWDLGCDLNAVNESVRPLIQDFWAANGLDGIAELTFRERGAAGINNLYDIFHPAGTTRMGTTPATGVVDPNLQIFGLDNAYVLSSAVFPSLGSANPTFTVLALGLRLADFLFQKIENNR